MSIFDTEVSNKKMPHSKFPIVNTNFLTTQFGIVTPFVCREVVPGDRIHGYASIYNRFMPLVSPVFSRCRAYVHYYFVPSRILSGYEAYEEFITGDSSKPNYRSYCEVNDIIDSLNHQYNNKFGTRGSALTKTLFDYMGVQTSDDVQSTNHDVVCLEPFIAFWKLILDHYVNTRTRFYVPYSWDSTNLVYNYGYINYDDLLSTYYDYTKNMSYNQHITSSNYNVVVTDSQGNPQTVNLLSFLAIGLYRCCYTRDYFTSAYPTSIGTGSTVQVGNTIDDLRANLASKEYLERWARSGDTVGDWLWQFFKVKSPDSRLNRSEFLGGGRMNMDVTEVLQTSESTNESPLGDIGGVAKKKSAVGFGKRYFTEFGWFIGVIFFVPQQAYYQGIKKHFRKIYRNDLYNKVFDGLGDELVHKSEIYSSPGATQNPLGYQPRYLDYKIATNEVHGDFCHSLRAWHASRYFSVNPSLDTIQYVSPSPDGINRIFAYDGTEDPVDFSKIVSRIKLHFVFKRKMRYFGYPHL